MYRSWFWCLCKKSGFILRLIWSLTIGCWFFLKGYSGNSCVVLFFYSIPPTTSFCVSVSPPRQSLFTGLISSPSPTAPMPTPVSTMPSVAPMPMPTVATMPVELVQKLSRMEEQLGQMGKGLRVDEQMLRFSRMEEQLGRLVRMEEQMVRIEDKVEDGFRKTKELVDDRSRKSMDQMDAWLCRRYLHWHHWHLMQCESFLIVGSSKEDSNMYIYIYSNKESDKPWQKTFNQNMSRRYCMIMDYIDVMTFVCVSFFAVFAEGQTVRSPVITGRKGVQTPVIIGGKGHPKTIGDGSQFGNWQRIVEPGRLFQMNQSWNESNRRKPWK